MSASLVRVGFLAAALAETGAPVLTDRVPLILGAVAVPDPFCVLVLEGLGEGVVAAGFVDCLLAVVVPGTGGFLAAAEDMIALLTAVPCLGVLLDVY